MKIVNCSFEQHAESILEILNDAILNSTALYDYKPRTTDSMTTWFKTKEDHRFPVIGIESESGELMGFASYGLFRAWPAYKYTVEHSVYVHKAHRSKGLATTLMGELIEIAKKQNYHVMIGGIDINNAISINLHEKLGFILAGTIKQAGFKFGKWLDLAFYQLILETPSHPIDG
jgi:phosphinothricin acetyltransferase